MTVTLKGDILVLDDFEKMEGIEMTLEEVAYVIGGNLKVGNLNGEGGIEGYSVELTDSIEEMCQTSGVDTINAIGTGKTESDARSDLAERIRGKVLLYEVPGPMWKTTSCTLRIPPTLTGQADPKPKVLDFWEQLSKMPGGGRNPFDTPLGPTDECLSSNQTVFFVQSGEISADIRAHIKSCASCREHIDRFKKVCP